MHATAERMLLALQRGYDPYICFWVRVARDLFYVYVVNDSCVRIVHDVESPRDHIRTYLLPIASSRFLTELC